MKLYMFRTVRLSIIRSLFTVHSAMVYVIQVCRQHSSRTILVLFESCLQTCMTYTIAECTVNKLLMMDRRTVLNTKSWLFLRSLLTDLNYSLLRQNTRKCTHRSRNKCVHCSLRQVIFVLDEFFYVVALHGLFAGCINMWNVIDKLTFTWHVFLNDFVVAILNCCYFTYRKFKQKFSFSFVTKRNSR
jgi:hypothetical protein